MSTGGDDEPFEHGFETQLTLLNYLLVILIPWLQGRLLIFTIFESLEVSKKKKTSQEKHTHKSMALNLKIKLLQESESF